MIKVEYGLPRKDLARFYIHIFDNEIKSMRKGWCRLRKKIISISSSPNLYNKSIDEIMTMQFEDLNDLYEDYSTLRNAGKISDELNEKLSMLFRYDAQSVNIHNCLHKKGRKVNKLWSRSGYQPRISLFFANPRNGFQIHTCHYCDTSYINVFGYSSIYRDVLTLANSGIDDDLKAFIVKEDGTAYKDCVYNSIKSHQPYSTINDFDKLSVWSRGKRKHLKSVQIENSVSNQYDLDHVLPKSKCPIVGLSLFNFVPSCQVCNEKLKKEKELGYNKNERKKLSPTTDHYSFEVTFQLHSFLKIVPKMGYMAHPDNYYIDVVPTDPIFESSISLFKLKERYNYHKSEALNLMDKLTDYNDSNIKMIHNAFDDVGLGSEYTEEKIKEDLFGERFSDLQHRAFSKLKKDIIQQYRSKISTK